MKDETSSRALNQLTGLFSLPTLLSILVSFVIIIWYVSVGNNIDNESLNRLDYLLYDYRYNMSYEKKNELRETKESNVIIIDIDEKSLKNEGRWPWSREKVAKLTTKLAEAGVAVAAFDITFSESETMPIETLLRFTEDSKTKLLLNDLAQQYNPDKEFSEAISFAYNNLLMSVVIGYFFDAEPIKIGMEPTPISSLGNIDPNKLTMKNFEGYISNLDVLRSETTKTGSITTFPDGDGVMRRSPLVFLYNNNIYPSFSVAIILSYLLAFDEDFKVNYQDANNNTVIESISLLDKTIYTDPSGKILIPYIGPAKSYSYISATDVLNDEANAEELSGAIALIGTSAHGLFDLKTTPLSKSFPGVEVHANIINAVLNDNLIIKPDWEAGLITLILVLVATIISFSFPRIQPVWLAIYAISLLLTTWYSSYYLWVYYNFDLSTTAILLLILAVTFTNFAYGFFKENTNKKELKGMFGQYVPPAHIDRMVNSKDEDFFSSEAREMSVLFSDIRNFTTISENLSASQLTQMLNTYFNPITEIIFNHEGTIDKYVGDMVMAFWGAPLNDENHKEHSILAGLDMLQKTEELKSIFKKKGLPEINIGVGINSGLMNVGDMGSKYRKAYTVLGDVVNLASRLESLTKFYGVKFLVGQDMLEGIDNFTFKLIDKIQAKGKSMSVKIYEPIGLTSTLSTDTIKETKLHHQALNYYWEQNWQKSKSLFNELYQQYNNKRLYAIYIERIKLVENNPHDDDWNGVYIHTQK